MTTTIEKLSASTLLQSIQDESILESFTDKFTSKITSTSKFLLTGMLMLGMAGFLTNANAYDGNSARVGMGVSGVMGTVLNGSGVENLPPECANIQGVNGWKVGGAGVAGSVAGASIGRGSGTKWATVALTAISSAAALSAENNRIQRECNAVLARIDMQNKKSLYSSNQNQYNANYNYSALPSINPSDILYEYTTPNGNKGYATISNSPGLLAINGGRNGEININSNPTIYKGVSESLNNLAKAYENLNTASKAYISYSNGTDDEIFNPNPSANKNNDTTKISVLKNQYNAAYDNYAERRGIAAHILDEASTRNYNLSDFKDSNILFVTPHTAKVTYQSVNGISFENKFYQGNIKRGY